MDAFATIIWIALITFIALIVRMAYKGTGSLREANGTPKDSRGHLTCFLCHRPGKLVKRWYFKRRKVGYEIHCSDDLCPVHSGTRPSLKSAWQSWDDIDGPGVNAYVITEHYMGLAQ